MTSMYRAPTLSEDMDRNMTDKIPFSHRVCHPVGFTPLDPTAFVAMPMKLTGSSGGNLRKRPEDQDNKQLI